MTLMNNDANLKQFRLIKYMNENCSDDHVISKISIVLRRDKIEAPYYMVVKIKLSTCIDRPENGLIHAMDVLNHLRRYNLTENNYNEIKSLIKDASESDLVKITENDSQLKMTMFTRNDDENCMLFKEHQELFEKIDSLIE